MKAVWILLLTLAAGACAQTREFEISGTLVDSRNGKPVRNARVVLDRGSGRPSGTPLAFVKTGADGRFGFAVDAPGAYMLTAEHRGMIQGYGDQGSATGLLTAIRVGPGLPPATGVVFRWRFSAAISGRVLDAQGEPVERAQVIAVRAGVQHGRRTFRPYVGTETDAKGEYRLGPLPESSYFVVVTAKPYAIPGAERIAELTRQDAYLPIAYPGTPSLDAKAKPIVVTPGAEIHQDFTMRLVPGATVNLHHPETGGRNGMLTLIPEGIPDTIGAAHIRDGLWGTGHKISGVPPGTYVMRSLLSSQGVDRYAERTITLSEGENPVELTFGTPASVSGVVLLAPGLKESQLSIRLVDDRRPMQTIPVAAGANGRFRSDSVYPGEYRIVLSANSDSYIVNVKASGAALRSGRVLTIAEGASVVLEIEAGNSRGSVRGVTVDSAGKPKPGALAVLFDTARTEDPSRRFAVQSDSDGGFTFDRVPEGEYIIAAVDDPDFAYAETGDLETLLGMGRRITVKAGRPANAERVPLVGVR